MPDAGLLKRAASGTIKPSYMTAMGDHIANQCMCLPHLQNMAEYMSAWRGTRYWCDGVLTLAVGGIGFVGNIFSILILSSR